MYPARTVFDSGAKVTFSSDEWWGGEMLATYINSYLGMQVGHTRQYQKIGGKLTMTLLDLQSMND